MSVGWHILVVEDNIIWAIKCIKSFPKVYKNPATLLTLIIYHFTNSNIFFP